MKMLKLSSEDKQRIEKEILPQVINDPEQAAQQIVVYENLVYKLKNIVWRCVHNVERSDIREAADLLNITVPE